MSKSVKVTEKTYNQIQALKDAGFGSLTNALSVAVDRLAREGKRHPAHAIAILNLDGLAGEAGQAALDARKAGHEEEAQAFGQLAESALQTRDLIASIGGGDE